MNITVTPSVLAGSITAPPSKSLTLRALAAAFLSKEETVIRNPSGCDDVRNACASLEILGTDIIEKKDHLVILPRSPKGGIISCGESALWLRMMAPILSLFPEAFTLTAKGSLQKRPVEMMVKPLEELGVRVIASSVPPVTVKGPLRPGSATIDGRQTSQFISGLLFALPLLPGPSVLNITSLTSRPYIQMTIKFLAEYGIFIEMDKSDTVYIHGSQHFSKINYTVKGDWSGGASFLIAGALHGPVTVSGLDSDSFQGDKAVLSVLRSAGACINEGKNGITVSRGSLKAFDYDATHTPDLIPPLAALAAFCHGTSRIRGVARITQKESNRAEALSALLSGLGIPVHLSKDFIAVTGHPARGGTVASFRDHRIAMTAAIIASGAGGDVTIEEADSVDKSYPSFFEDFKRLGGLIHE